YFFFFFFFTVTSTPEIYTLSLHDALPIYRCCNPTAFANDLRRGRLCTRRGLFHHEERGGNVGDSLLSILFEAPADQRPHRCRNIDRKSTRLNSSHLVISYAVFCLKKKKKK